MSRSIIGILLLLAADVRAQAPAAVVRDTSATAVVRDFVAAFNAHSVDRMLTLASPDIVWLSVVDDAVAVEARGAEALRTQMTAYFKQLPSARSELEEVIALGPWVSARERAHWVSATGPRSQASLSVYEVREGLVRRVWYYPVVR